MKQQLEITSWSNVLKLPFEIALLSYILKKRRNVLSHHLKQRHDVTSWSNVRTLLLEGTSLCSAIMLTLEATPSRLYLLKYRR